MSRLHPPSQTMQRRSPRDVPSLVALSLTLVLWASAFAGIRAGLTGYSAGALILLRFLIASGALLMYALVTRMRMPDRRDIPAMVLLGFIGITVYQLGLTYGETSVSAGTAGLLIATVPCFTVILATLFLGERFSVWGWVGLLVSFTGVALISLNGNGGLHFTPGALLILLASFSESVYFVVQKRYLRKYSGLELATYNLWGGTLFMLIFLPTLWQELPHAPLGATLAIVFLGLFPAAVANLVWTFALSRTSASAAISFLNISPVFSLIIAWLWLREVPSPIALGGGLVVILGVLLINLKGKVSVRAEQSADPFEAEAQPQVLLLASKEVSTPTN